MSKRARTVTRSLIAGLAIVGLLAACGGDDDDSADDTTTTTEAEPTDTDEGTDDGATDEGTDEPADSGFCELLDIESINSATGEQFTQAIPDATGCTLANADGSAVLKLDLHSVPDDAEAAKGITDAQTQCDEGTVREDLDFSYADQGGFGCTVDGKATLAAAHDDGVGFLVAQPSTDVPEDALFAVLAQILKDLALA